MHVSLCRHSGSIGNQIVPQYRATLLDDTALKPAPAVLNKLVRATSAATCHDERMVRTEYPGVSRLRSPEAIQP